MDYKSSVSIYALAFTSLAIAALPINYAHAQSTEVFSHNNANKNFQSKISLFAQSDNFQAPTLPNIFGSNSQSPVSATAQGTDVVLLVADEIIQGTNEGEIEARGNVEAKHQGRRLTADKLVYDTKTGIVTAKGNVIIIEPDGSSSYAQEIVVDDKLASGVVQDFASRLNSGGLVAAKTAVRREGDKNVLSKVIYTACPVCEGKNERPTWAIRARNATQNQHDNSISYNDVFFEIEGVPIFYTPYFRHGDPSAGRQSGLLLPSPGSNSRLGHYVSVPYLKVIDDYSDLTIAPFLSEYVNPVLFSEYRRNFYSGKLLLSGSITKEQLFGRKQKFYGKDDWRGHLFGKGEFKINDVWNWGFGVETASDDLYISRYKIRGRELNSEPVRTSGSRLLNQAYISGKNDDFYARIMSLHFQELIPGEIRKNTPQVLPSIELHKSWNVGPNNGRLGLDSSMVYLDRIDNRQDTGRASVSLNWKNQNIVGNGIIISPEALIKGDYYTYNHQKDKLGVDIGNHRYSRINGIIGVDMRWPLQRFEKKIKLTMEPRINLSYASKDNIQGDLSIEEANGIENNASSYFITNRSSINDIWNNGGRATIGMTLGASGIKNSSINWFVGKQYQTENNSYFDNLSNLNKKQGDWVTNLALQIGREFNLQGIMSLDSKTGKLVRTEFLSSLNIGRMGLVVKYHDLPLREGSISRANRELVSEFNFKITDKISIFAADWHDFRSEKSLLNRYGINFGDDCTNVRAYYEEINTTNRLVGPSRNYRIQVAFKTLGMINDEPFGN